MTHRTQDTWPSYLWILGPMPRHTVWASYLWIAGPVEARPHSPQTSDSWYPCYPGHTAHVLCLWIPGSMEPRTLIPVDPRTSVSIPLCQGTRFLTSGSQDTSLLNLWIPGPMGSRTQPSYSGSRDPWKSMTQTHIPLDPKAPARGTSPHTFGSQDPRNPGHRSPYFWIPGPMEPMILGSHTSGSAHETLDTLPTYLLIPRYMKPRAQGL